jgi:alkylation response protein AidB-like acyl-CoA dehydrogenase
MRPVSLPRKSLDMIPEPAIFRRRAGPLPKRLSTRTRMIADSRIQAGQFRPLVPQTAWNVDPYGDCRRGAKGVPAVKTVMPMVHRNVRSCRPIDRPAHGGLMTSPPTEVTPGELDDLRATVRAFLADRLPLSDVRKRMESDEEIDRGVWRQLASELELQAIHIPEAYGGQGFGFSALTVVLAEFGRALADVPYFSTVCLAANAILNSADERHRRQLLPPIARGEVIAALAYSGDATSELGQACTVTADRSADGRWMLNGTVDVVLGGGVSELFIVVARTPGMPHRIGLFAAYRGSPGLSTRALTPMDLTRPLAEVAFIDVAAELLGDPAEAESGLSTTLLQGTACLAAEMVGGAERCMEMAVEYAKGRYQFGAPIGSFQAIQHKCANMLVDVESARAAAIHAMSCCSAGHGDMALWVSHAKAYCSEIYPRVASDALQVHGGLGFTWEHDIHMYLKRAQSTRTLLGDDVAHRRRVAELLGI